MPVTSSDIEKEGCEANDAHLLVQIPRQLRDRIQLLRAGYGRHRCHRRFRHCPTLDTVRRPVKSVRLNNPSSSRLKIAGVASPRARGGQ